MFLLPFWMRIEFYVLKRIEKSIQLGMERLLANFCKEKSWRSRIDFRPLYKVLFSRIHTLFIEVCSVVFHKNVKKIERCFSTPIYFYILRRLFPYAYDIFSFLGFPQTDLSNNSATS